MSEQNSAKRLEKLVAAPAALTMLVDYQEGAVVSRAVLAKPSGTVTLFAFDAGQSLSEHTSPYDALVCGLEGEGELTVSGKPLALRTGDAVILPAHEPHALKTTQRFKMLLAMIRS